MSINYNAIDHYLVFLIGMLILLNAYPAYKIVNFLMNNNVDSKSGWNIKFMQRNNWTHASTKNPKRLEKGFDGQQHKRAHIVIYIFKKIVYLNLKFYLFNKRINCFL